MDDSVVLYLPFPPTVNSYYAVVSRAAARGVRRISRRGREFSSAVEESLSEQLPMGLPVSMFPNPSEPKLYVDVVLYPPDHRPRDLDNYMKALLDACTKAGLWVDDQYIDQLEIKRGVVIPPRGASRLEITLAGPIMPWIGN